MPVGHTTVQLLAIGIYIAFPQHPDNVKKA